MRDFSIQIYQRLLDILQESGYAFQTFSGYLQDPQEKTIILRHDVDDRKLHSLHFAQMQYERGITGTFYFRVVPQSFDEGVIRAIADMGHEIGYHYEDMDFAKGDPNQAVRLFEQHLTALRRLAPIKTICMHGSPRSPYDNKEVWRHYSYRDYGIEGEPYFDIDFDRVFYLTDTGRRWDGYRVSLRDKVDSRFQLAFSSTEEIIHSLRKGKFPDQVMMNFHPQRWTDSYPLWFRELILQKLKNGVKYWLVNYQNRNR